MKKYRFTKARKELLKKIGFVGLILAILILSSIECYHATGVATGLLSLF